MLQLDIEKETMIFDEVGVYQSNPQLMKKLIGKDKITAREYLKNQEILSDIELHFLSQLGEYTLEAMIVHVLGILYNPIKKRSNVNVASLIDYLDMFVRDYASFGMKKDLVELLPRKGNKKDFTIGVGLVEFLLKGDVMSINSPDFNIREVGSAKFKSTSLMCNFDCSLLPIKLNLPMVYYPIKWCSNKANPKSLMDLSGGYLTNYHKIDIYNRFRLLTSKDKNNFYIDLKDANKICNILNKLQSQPFEINERLLMFIKENYDDLVEAGLLTNRNLSNVNLKYATDKLRVFYFNHPYIGRYFPNKELKDLLNDFTKLVQKARYEDFVLYLAETYNGFRFYLPAFMDFRGRIYRSGVLHFHERDLAKGLITFAKSNTNTVVTRNDFEVIMAASAFKYAKFEDNYNAHNSYTHKIYKDKLNGFGDINIFDKIQRYISTAKEAIHPFQFLAKSLTLEDPLRMRNNPQYHSSNKGTMLPPYYSDLMSTPLSQDASASAYQIMSYLLLNKEMAILTNLIPENGNKSIRDLYLTLLKDLKSFLKERF